MVKLGLKEAIASGKISAGIEALEGDTSASSDDQMFADIVKSYKEKFPLWDLSHMKMIKSSDPRNHDGDVKTDELERKKFTGSWTKLDTIVINSNMDTALEFYGIKDRVSAEDLTRQAIAHELAHEIWKYQGAEFTGHGFLRKAKDICFDTPYLHHIGDDNPDEELFCEYIAYRVTGVWVKCK